MSDRVQPDHERQPHQPSHWPRNDGTLQRQGASTYGGGARACPSGNVEVEGHTRRKRRSPGKMSRLSRDRTRTVMAYLVARERVSADRLSAVGFGPDRPGTPVIARILAGRVTGVSSSG